MLQRAREKLSSAMSFSLTRTAAWFFSASLVVACGAEFSAGNSVDAGSGGSSGSANPGSGGSTSGASGTGGASGSGAGSGGTSSGGGGVDGTAGVSGQAGDGGVSGRGGVGGTGGSSGRGGVGGSGGASGRGGVSGGPEAPRVEAGSGDRSWAAAGGRGGSAGNPGDAGPDASCQQQDAKCSDNSCARLLWTFDSGALDGLQSVSGHTLAVRTFDGSAALAVDVVQLNQSEISFTLPICLTGTLNLSSKTLSFRVNFAGGPPTAGELYVGALLSGTSTGYISDIYPATGGWITYSDMLSKATQSSAAKTITIRIGSTGAPFSGTVWFDDFRIQ